MTTKRSSSYLAHVRQNEDGTWERHELEDHLRGAAELASRFAETFGSSDWAGIAALWHDLGKYGQDFQNYIKSASGYEPEVHIETGNGRAHHSSAGALYAVEQLEIHGRILAYLIAGHHAGLPDWHKIDSGAGGSLQSRLNDTALLPHALEATIPEDILHSDEPTTPPIGGKQGFALWVRMLFSSLVDADFLDTEAFMDREKSADRGVYPPISELLSLFNLESAVGQGRECTCGGADQGSLQHILCLRHLCIHAHRATTRNSYSIPRSCNTEMRRHKRAIYPVA